MPRKIYFIAQLKVLYLGGGDDMATDWKI